MTRRWLLLPLLLVLFRVDVARADDAVQLYKRGQQAFDAGRYQDAIEAFRAGYELDPRPEFLLNLAQCHRALGHHDRAIEYLERFIDEAPAGHRLRPAAEKTLGELKRAAPREEPREEPASEARPREEPPERPKLTSPPRVVSDPGRPRRRVPIVPEPETPRRDSSHVWVWVAAASAVVAVVTTVFVVTRMDSGDEAVDDTIRLPPP